MNEFEETPAPEVEPSGPKTGERKQPFRNELNRGDSLTTGYAYINSVRQHGDNLFVSIGLLSGREHSEGQDEFVPAYENLDLLVGRTASRSFCLLIGEYSKDSGKLFGYVEIRNLRRHLTEKGEETYLNSKGILETFQLGYLDK